MHVGSALIYIKNTVVTIWSWSVATKSGGIAPAPRGIRGTATYNPLTEKIIVGPSGIVSGLSDCTGSNFSGVIAMERLGVVIYYLQPPKTE